MVTVTLSGCRVFRSFISVCVGALLLIFGLAPVRAVDFDSFGTPPVNDPPTFSIGVYRLIVDTNTTWWTILTNYPGFFTNGDAVTLTSPSCYDPATTIGRGEAYVWNNPTLSGGESVGTSLSTIIKTADYAAVPSFFSGASGNTRKLFTEMRAMTLVGTILNSDPGHTNQCTNCFPPARFQVPPPPAYTGPLIWAGAMSPSPDPLPISRGQVQSKSTTGIPALDFPAQSFFNIYAEAYVPTIGLWPDAYVTNSDPLVVTNQTVTNFPPTVVYIHGETPAVPVYFANNSAYWTAGQRFGWMILAGHGVLSNNVVCPPCNAVTAAIANTFGTNNELRGLPLAVDSFYGTNTCPPAQVTYSSPANAVTNVFTNAGSLLLRKVRHSNLPNPIGLPAPGGSTTYSASGTTIEFDISQNGGGTWTHITAPANVSISITGTTDAGPPRVFRTEMLQLDISGGNLPPAVRVRESPTKQSLGRTSSRSVDGGYRVSSYFDVNLEVSIDGGGTWAPSDSPTTVVLSQPVSYTVVLAPGQNLICNQLDHGSNTLDEVMPNMPDGATLVKWNDGTGSFDPAETYFGGFGWDPGLTTLSPGEVAFVNNPGTSFPVTFTGHPHEYKLLPALAPGSNHGISQQSASVGTYESITGRSPGEGSQLLRWNGSGYTQYTFTGGAWSPPPPLINIGEGVFVRGPNAGIECLSIDCPTNITVTSLDGQPVNVAIPTPTVHKYCGSNATVTMDPTGPYPVGTTTVTVTAMNDSSLVTCTFKVIVNQATAGTITISHSGAQVSLNWSGGGVLQSSDTVLGPYIDIDPTATSPYLVIPSPLIKQQFYRLRVGQPGFTFYDTEMTQLDISGGNLPSGMRLRESPTLQSLGKTAIQQQPNGQFVISSYFDIRPELSLDNGQTWSASTSAPPHMSLVGTFKDSNVPPTNSTYVSPDEWHALYASGIEVTNADHLGFLGSFPPPPAGGVTVTHSFSSTAQMLIKLCPTCPFQVISAPAQTTVQMKSR